MKKSVSVLLIIAVLFLLASCSANNTHSADHSNTDQSTNITTVTTMPATPTPSVKIGLNDKVKLGCYEVKFIGANVHNILDKTSEYDMAIALDIEIKNISQHRIDLMSLDMPAYDSDGNEVQTRAVGQFFDDALDFTKQLNPDESVASVYYIGYTGNGEYTIEVFDATSDLFYVCVNIAK